MGHGLCLLCTRPKCSLQTPSVPCACSFGSLASSGIYYWCVKEAVSGSVTSAAPKRRLPGYWGNILY